MSDNMRERIKSYTNDYLLTQYHIERDTYTPQAIKAMEEEIASRNISEEERAEFLQENTAEIINYDRSDFVELENAFSQSDILLAYQALSDSAVPFFIDSPGASGALPTQTEADKLFKIHVHKDHMETAGKELDTIFSASKGIYTAKELGLKERLKAVNFYEIKLSDDQLEEHVEASLSDKERSVLARYARRLLDEAETIEAAMERPLFYYDNVEDLIAKVESGNEPTLNIGDLFTALEIFQAYIDDTGFPEDMDATIEGLLNFCAAISNT